MPVYNFIQVECRFVFDNILGTVKVEKNGDVAVVKIDMPNVKVSLLIY